MSLLWVICGAGSNVGKTHLAQRLCELLPNAACAKLGCHKPQPGKPENYFQTDNELADFVDTARKQHPHVVVESNEWARKPLGDLIIYIDGIAGETDFRDDAPRLLANAHIRIGPAHPPDDLLTTLREKLDEQTTSTVAAALNEHHQYLKSRDVAVREVDTIRVSAAADSALSERNEVLVEQQWTISINDVGDFESLCTPCDVDALAVGFAYSLGVINTREDLVAIDCDRSAKRVHLRLKNDPPRIPARSANDLLTKPTPRSDALRLNPQSLRDLVSDMLHRQRLFARTGAAHAVGIFDNNASLFAFGEDIGRHNAFDKALGRCLLRGKTPAGCGVTLSGRANYELLAKAVRVGVEIVAGVSAPSSLAIEIATKNNITLAGFVRDQRATLYAHPHRIQ
jgi:FdhD protein